jgi:membrane-associated phospholipid phosphatase
VLAAWFVLLLAVIALDFRAIPSPGIAIAAHGAGLLVALAVPWMAKRLPAERAHVLRAAVSLLMVPFAFEALGHLVPYVSPDSRESWLRRADLLLFGSDPTRWIGSSDRFPWLTEVLQLVYMSFFFLPLILAARLIARRDWRGLERATLVIVLGFFISYLGYLLVPARSPYHLQSYSFELEGVLLTPALRWTIATLENVKYDCFPSGHSMIAMLVAALAWKHDRRAFWWGLGGIGVLLPLSTIYLRYHYAVDVIAAVPAAWLTWWLASVLDVRSNRGGAPAAASPPRARATPSS